MRGVLLAICFIAGCELRSAYTEVNRIGPPSSPREARCPLRIFPSGPPPYPHQDIGYARATCPRFIRNECFTDLKRTACLSGADTIYGLNESVSEHSTHLTATFSQRPIDSGGGVSCEPPWACTIGAPN